MDYIVTVHNSMCQQKMLNAGRRTQSVSNVIKSVQMSTNVAQTIPPWLRLGEQMSDAVALLIANGAVLDIRCHRAHQTIVPLAAYR